MRDDVIVLLKVASSRWTCLHRCHEVTLSDAKLVMGRAAIPKELRTEVRTPPMTKHWAHVTAFFQYCLRIALGIAVARMLRCDTGLELAELRKVASETSGEPCAIGLHDTLIEPLALNLRHSSACILASWVSTIPI